MGKVQQDAIAAKHNIVFLPFQASNVPDAAGTYKTVEPASNDYLMAWAGSIVGMSVRHNADLTGGVITHRATIDGTANAAFTVVTDDLNQQAYKTIEARTVTFLKGQRIGMDWIKNGTVAPTTTDVSAGLWVLLEDIDL
jgi:hypothetical protein